MTTELHADERKILKASVARRALRIAQLCGPKFDGLDTGTWTMLVGNYGLGLVMALCRLAGDQMRAKWFGWLVEQEREWIGCCPFCGRQKDTPGDFMCKECVKECEDSEQELQMEELRDMPAVSDLAPDRDAELKKLADEPDSRD